MISLCTGSPPGELTETASATARDVLISESLFATFSVLTLLFIKLQVLLDDAAAYRDWETDRKSVV